MAPWYEANREKLRAKAMRAEKRQDRAKREAMKTIPELIAEAQTVFNEFIRLRDRHKGLLCVAALSRSAKGGDFDAGHIRKPGRGRAPAVQRGQLPRRMQSPATAAPAPNRTRSKPARFSASARPGTTP